MELTPELIGTIAVGAFVALGAIGNYLQKLKAQPPNPVLTGIIGEYGNREQTDRLILVHERIAKAVEALADKRAGDKHQEILDRINEIEEHGQRPTVRRHRPKQGS